jgi:peptide/nickel transport system permease protein
MVKFIAKRFGVLLFTMLAVSFILFLTFEFSPGDQAKSALGQYATKEELDLYRVRNGLERPFLSRYLEWLGVGPNYNGEFSGLLQGNLGFSHRWRAPVNTFIGTACSIPPFLPSLPLPSSRRSDRFSVLAGMRGPVLTGRSRSSAPSRRPRPVHRRHSHDDLPSGTFLVLLPGTSTSGGGDWSVASQLMLPVATLTAYYLGYLVRMVRLMVEVATRPYVTAVRDSLAPTS